ncbi:MAG: aldehyde dehydrogenase family protein [Alteraurantiacibacter sp.]
MRQNDSTRRGALDNSDLLISQAFVGNEWMDGDGKRAASMKKLGLELGGNAPLLIFDDADLDTAVEAASLAKFRNGGQSCIAANRIYVQDGFRDRFLDSFAKRVSAMKVGGRLC